jgi:Uma2 family endonuclease
VTDPARTTPWTVDAYFAMEATSPEKHQFWNGEVYAMAGGSPEHNLISANMVRALGEALRAHRCRVYGSDQKVHVPVTNGFVYPDVTVACDGLRFHAEHSDVLVDPRLLVEVLSESTERFDRGDKFEGYRSLPSLTDYVLVSQRDRHLEHYARQADGSWLLREYRGHARVAVASLGITIDLDEVYLKVFDTGTSGG